MTMPRLTARPIDKFTMEVASPFKKGDRVKYNLAACSMVGLRETDKVNRATRLGTINSKPCTHPRRPEFRSVMVKWDGLKTPQQIRENILEKVDATKS